MTATSPTEPPQSPAPAPARRKGPPAWGVLLVLVLLGGMVFVNRLATTRGPAIAWTDNDLDAALARVDAAHPRVFLYLFEPNDPAHQRNEREVFTQKWAKDALAMTVPCRVAVGTDRNSLDLCRRFIYKKNTPLFLLLTRQGTPVSRTEGPVTELEFMTYIGRPAEQAHKNRATGGGE